MKAAITGILIGASLFAHTQKLTEPALGFNVFVKGGARLVTNETEGPVAMGGDLTLAGNYVVAAKSAGTFKTGSTTIGLLVGGKVTYSAGNQTYVNNGYVKLGNCSGSNVYYKDNNSTTANMRITNGNYGSKPAINLQTTAIALGVSETNNPVCQGGLVDFTKAFATMQANSRIVAAMPTYIELTNPNGDKQGTTIPAVLTNGQLKVNLKTGTNIMNVTGAELNSVTGNITFNNAPDANRVLVINVNAAGTFNWRVWNQAGVALQHCPYIVYNFYNTTNLQIQGSNSIEGTLFAPFADINKTVNQANIEGQVVGLSFIHSGGENHYANFVPTLGIIDTDNDGVPDSDDNYPNDPAKAFNNLFPASGFSTLMYEDLWPYKGDYDFNDLVVDYRFNTITNASNFVTEVQYSFVPKAAGAILKNGFGFQLDGISTEKIVSVTGTKMTAGWSALNSNGTEAGHTTHSNIIVFDYVNKVFNNLPAGATVINTFAGLSNHKADTIKIVVRFQPGTVSFATLTAARFNPYLIVDQTRGREVHLADRIPTAKIDRAYFGLGTDNSNPGTGRYYKTKENLPWALNIVNSIPYPLELVDFTTAYPTFIKWAASNGTGYTDWYLNTPANRDPSKLYTR